MEDIGVEESILVSVVIPCYNHSDYVQETIQSVIGQDYENIELIVIDDGSTDMSVDKVLEMRPACNERFNRFEFRHRSNQGLSKTLNEALEWCRGEYVSCLASDDLIKSYKISSQVNFLQNNQAYVGVFGGIDIIHKDGTTSRSLGTSQEYDFEKIIKHKYCLPAPTQLLRLNEVKEVGGFREGFIIEDWMMWLELTKNGGLLYCDSRPVATYRRHDGNLSGQLNRMLEGRLQIVNEFSDNELYKDAKANVYMAQGFDTQIFSKLGSLKYVYKSVCIKPSIVFTRDFLLYIAKFFLKGKSIIG